MLWVTANPQENQTDLDDYRANTEGSMCIPSHQHGGVQIMTEFPFCKYIKFISLYIH